MITRINEMITEWEDCKEVVEFAHRTGREKITYKKYLNIIRLFLSDLKELKKSSKDLIHEVVFKMYCPLVAKGVDKTILKEIAYDLLRQYGIEKINKGKAMDFKDEINKVNQSSYNNDRVVIVILVCIIAVLIIACLF